MTTQLDVNTIASWAAVVAAAAGAARFGRRASRWFEKTDERLGALEKGQTEVKEEQAATKEQVEKINAQLRPNGGGSHHDVLRREIREAVEEAAGTRRRRWW